MYNANLSHEDGLELQHASNGEQHCWVIRYQGATWQPDMLMLLIEFEEAFSDLCTSQLWRNRYQTVRGRLCVVSICMYYLRSSSARIQNRQQRFLQSRDPPVAVAVQRNSRRQCADRTWARAGPANGMSSVSYPHGSGSEWACSTLPEVLRVDTSSKEDVCLNRTGT